MGTRIGPHFMVEDQKLTTLMMIWIPNVSYRYSPRRTTQRSLNGRFIYCWLLEWTFVVGQFLVCSDIVLFRLFAQGKPTICFADVMPSADSCAWKLCWYKKNDYWVNRYIDTGNWALNVKAKQHCQHDFEANKHSVLLR